MALGHTQNLKEYRERIRDEGHDDGDLVLSPPARIFLGDVLASLDDLDDRVRRYGQHRYHEHVGEHPDARDLPTIKKIDNTTKFRHIRFEVLL